MELQRLSLDEWDDALPDRGIEPFHTSAALSVLAEHSETTLHLLGGFKGDRPTALFPAFERSLPIGRLVSSPPAGMNVPRLGPVMQPASPKQRKREQVFDRFTDLVVDELALDAPTTLFNMSCRTAFADPRAYVWRSFDLSTRFTYQLDLANQTPDDLLSNASKSLRREIRDADDIGVVVSREGTDAVRRVFEQTRDRYEEQGRTFTPTWPYVRDLARALGDMMRVYVARSPDGTFLTGVTVCYSPEAAYFWQGGGRTIHDGVAVNSRLHWEILEDIATDPPRDSVDTYDLYGANTERLCRYKSKFGADLVPYYRIHTGGIRMDLATRMYELIAR